MYEKNQHLYEFGSFTLNPVERLLLKNGKHVHLPPKAFETLLVLVKNGGHLIRKDLLLEEVWSEAAVEEGTIPGNITQIRKALGDNRKNPEYIETVQGQGYRFIAPVKERLCDFAGSSLGTEEKNLREKDQSFERQDEHETTVSVSPSKTISERLPFGGYKIHVSACCFLYAALYTVALFIEIAYVFDRLGPTAMRLAPVVFSWMFSTSIFGLWVSWKRAPWGASVRLTLSLTVFTSAALLLYLFLGTFLPAEPITDANFQTYTAHVAYLKSVCYFLFIAVLFMILPFHLVVALRKECLAGNRRLVMGVLKSRRLSAAPGGTVYLRVWWLGIILSVGAVLALALTGHLFENLKPGQYMNMFMQLAQWRLILFFVLGAECLLWYYRSLNEFKRETYA